MAAAVAGASSAVAVGAATGGAPIDACVGPTGHLRVVNGSDCLAGESALSWNRTGPAGAQGERGPQGPSGPAGPAGPAGLGDARVRFVEDAGEVTSDASQRDRPTSPSLTIDVPAHSLAGFAAISATTVDRGDCDAASASVLLVDADTNEVLGVSGTSYDGQLPATGGTASGGATGGSTGGTTGGTTGGSSTGGTTDTTTSPTSTTSTTEVSTVTAPAPAPPVARSADPATTTGGSTYAAFPSSQPSLFDAFRPLSEGRHTFRMVNHLETYGGPCDTATMTSSQRRLWVTVLAPG